MKRFVSFLILFSFCFLVSGYRVSAAEIGSLLNEPARWSGLEVKIKGEIVGNVLKGKGGSFWVNISDGSGAVGVYLPAKLVKSLEMESWKGSNYSMKGTELMIKGVFNSACSEHGGDLDLHALEVRVISGSRPIHHSLSVLKVGLALFLFFLALAVFFFTRS